MNPQCRTLVVCRSELVKGIASIGPEEVAADLLDKQLISNGVHKEILQSSNSTNDKAKSLIAAVIFNVRNNPGVQFRKFKAILSRHRRADLVQLLEDKFGAALPKDSYEGIEDTNTPTKATTQNPTTTTSSVSPNTSSSGLSSSPAHPTAHRRVHPRPAIATPSSPAKATSAVPILATPTNPLSPPRRTSPSPPLVTPPSPPGTNSIGTPEDARAKSPCPLHEGDFFKWLRQKGIGARDVQILQEEDIRVCVFGLYQEDEELCKQLSRGTSAILKYSTLKADLLHHFGEDMCRQRPVIAASPKKRICSSTQNESSVQQEEIKYSTQDASELTDADLGEVFIAIKNVCGKWYEVGLELKVDHAALSDIEATIKPIQGRLRETLRIWLLNGGHTRTWAVLAEAMKSHFVGRSDIGDRILSDHN